MQLILDEVHALQKEWQVEGSEWAGAGIINSSKVLAVTVSQVSHSFSVSPDSFRCAQDHRS